VDGATVGRLFTLPVVTANKQLSFENVGIGPAQLAEVSRLTLAQQQRIQDGIAVRNAEIFEAEADKLDGWADDLKLGLEREIKELDKQIKEARRAAVAAVSLEAKLAAQKQMKTMESHRSTKRRSLFDAQDEIDRKRGELIAAIERKLDQKVRLEPLFTIRWSVV
jgi:adenine-specific DNA-methyltransferase